MTGKSKLSGLLLIILGIFLLFGGRVFLVIGWAQLWPLFILIPGLIFEMAYFNKKSDPGLLVPGGVLITLALIFLVNGFTGYRFMGHLWPLFIMAPAVGLYQLYWFGDREKALFWVSAGLFGTALLFLFITSLAPLLKYIIPIGLIFYGFKIISGKHKKSKQDYEDF